MLLRVVGTKHQSDFAQMVDITIALPTDFESLHQTAKNAK